jgi:O-antigen/teichoic acid export membrane protein
MNPTKKVIKNSLWLFVQPLIFNIISIFVVGYIARTLGKEDYGKFLFAFAFVAMFAPFGNMGSRAIAVRVIAEDRSRGKIFLGKVFVYRLFFILLASGAILIVINLLDYPSATRAVVYIATVALVLNTVSSIPQDAFQAYENMQYISYMNFVTGAFITVLSVVVLFAGYRLIAITSVYMLGSLLGCIVGVYYLFRKGLVPTAEIDFSVWKQIFLEGSVFFYPALFGTIGMRIGVVLLSKMAGDASVGVYGAANNLVERVNVIPDSICTAFFPAMALAFKNSKSDARDLYQKIFLYLFLIGLPIAVGSTILARPIIHLIYGDIYAPSAFILQILAWAMFLTFLSVLQGWTLGAIHEEKKAAIVSFSTTSFFILLNVVMIPYLREIGVALSSVMSAVLSLIFSTFFIRKHLTKRLIKLDILLRVLVANFVMGILVYLFRELNVILNIAIAAVVYACVLLLFNVVKYRYVTDIKAIIFN